MTENNKLPKSISPVPIVESILQIKFIPNVPSETLMGIIYSKVKNILPNITNLPILELPESIRRKDPNLKYQAYHELQNKNLSFTVGPNAISFVNKKHYEGWNTYYKFIVEIIDSIKEIDIFKTVESFGLRYINFFENTPLDRFNLNIQVCGKDTFAYPTKLNIEYKENDLIKILQVSNNAIYTVNNISKKGSLIDIDCQYKLKNITGDEFYKVYNKILTETHNKEKELFFSLFTDRLLTDFNPIYSENNE